MGRAPVLGCLEALFWRWPWTSYYGHPDKAVPRKKKNMCTGVELEWAWSLLWLLFYMRVWLLSSNSTGSTLGWRARAIRGLIFYAGVGGAGGGRGWQRSDILLSGWGLTWWKRTFRIITFCSSYRGSSLSWWGIGDQEWRHDNDR